MDHGFDARRGINDSETCVYIDDMPIATDA